ncbi:MULTISPECIES: response regulator [Rhizobium]|uniref:DNA-binding NtrC family response regulator n=1 Tax=Rhizobium wenxiniae TaxID=1737357 RepID=A0A7W9YA76_9HYPH|nr:response regulator [Rhizobium wenxiniae]MBB6164707.1 DNA-binding NtrC family response regulator [Rhizobium wenxiniae]GGG06365.1 response regulator [Rhizobium wenxiniae]
MSSRTVLVAEDDILIRLMLVEALTDDGYHVVQAGTVLEAISAIGRNPTFDAMITDVDMPGSLTGLDLAAMVSSVAPRTEIIVASGRDVSDCVSPSWSFMPKPYSLDRILALLESRLGAPAQNGIVAQAI